MPINSTFTAPNTMLRRGRGLSAELVYHGARYTIPAPIGAETLLEAFEARHFYLSDCFDPARRKITEDGWNRWLTELAEALVYSLTPVETRKQVPPRYYGTLSAYRGRLGHRVPVPRR